MENFKILHEKENPLFGRKEIKFNVEAEKTPSRSEALKLISEKFSVLDECIKIKNILGSFGSGIFEISANLYKSKEDKDRLEIKKKKEEKSAEAEKPQEQAQNEKPAEGEKQEEAQTQETQKIEPTSEEQKDTINESKSRVSEANEIKDELTDNEK